MKNYERLKLYLRDKTTLLEPDAAEFIDIMKAADIQNVEATNENTTGRIIAILTNIRHICAAFNIDFDKCLAESTKWRDTELS